MLLLESNHQVRHFISDSSTLGSTVIVLRDDSIYDLRPFLCNYTT
jgi:hypothetical protein